MIRPAASIFLALSLVAGAFAQSQSIVEALRAPAKTITAAQIPNNYVAVSIDSEAGQNSTLALYGLAGLGGGGLPNARRASVLFGLADAILVDAEEFAELLNGQIPRLRGYKVDTGQMTIEAMVSAMSNQGNLNITSPKMPQIAFTETWIEASRIRQWTPRPSLTPTAILKALNEPDPAQQIGDRTEALSRAKQVATGMIMYASDYDEKFPAGDSTAAIRKVVLPYIKNEQVWPMSNPTTGRFLANTSLSGASLYELDNAYSLPIAWDEFPWPDGGRIVAFGDGHAKFVSSEEWTRVWRDELARREKQKAKAPSKAKVSPKAGLAPTLHPSKTKAK
ncbi:MAG: hypothetical protein ACOYON_08280 [Fimbriimonas sp.]